jgi:hypothetical protein
VTERDRNPNKALTYRELLDMSEDELIEAHDALAAQTGLHVGLNYYLEALRHKSQDLQTRQMVKYTLWITIMTGVVTLATIINLAIAFLMLRRM